ncbi:indoleacetamide hydrolase [Pseudomonas veronii]|jgi:indoleacetamide hydrolase|uniref:indoleacetamide hydrolase n=1 Tax=Pseudomonas veronii TaxID=76761 RepID=UPI002D78B720|nr:indoleacetamide hydrolase [Pseudomonas veronii]WRU61956.1 indoleacetamide hydrolase [Pseudomonas veronii]
MTVFESASVEVSTDLTIAEASEAFRNGVLSSVELVQACLKRAEAGKSLNVYVTLDRVGALQAAQAADAARQAGEPLKPLSGIPIVIKDNIHVAGLPCTAGSPAFAGFVPSEDSPSVQKLRDAGAIILGKTNMHELAFGATGYNGAYNTGSEVGVRNPYDGTRIAGGSSSGSAAALGARMALAALGTDTGGSMRIPPALNGCASLRPSAGRYSDRGVIPIARSRDTVGPMALCMADVALLDGVITGEYAMPSVLLGALRLGVPSEFWDNLDEDTYEQAMAAAETLRGHGVTLVPIEDAGLHALNAPVGFPVVIHEAYDCMVDYLRDYGHAQTIEQLAEKIYSPDVRWIYEHWVMPRKMPVDDQLVDVAPAYHVAQNGGRQALLERYQTLFERHQLDALLFPTTAIVAPLANDDVNQPSVFGRLIQNTEPAASAGLPCIQLPVGLGNRSGLPVGMELDGPPGCDRRLLAIGQLLEGLFGRVPRA